MAKIKKKSWKKIVGIVLIVLVVGAALVMVLGSWGGGVMEFKGVSTQGVSRDFAVEESMGFYGEGDLGMMAPSAPMVMPGFDGAVSDAGVSSDERQIIRTGNLSLVVVSVNEAVGEIKKLTEEKEGFVESSSVDELDDDSQMGWITIRVPADVFDEVMESLKGLATKVESENVYANDVTAQVVDLEARLTNLRSQEEQFRRILETAKTVEEVLMVTEQLNRVRWEIESVETQLKNLGRQVKMSTISVNLVDEGDVEIFGIYWRPILSLKQSLRNALENITTSIDYLFVVLFNLPLIIVWTALVSFAAWLLWKIGAKVWKKIS